MSPSSPLVRLLNNNHQPSSDIAYNVVYGVSDLFTGICNAYGMEVDQKGRDVKVAGMAVIPGSQGGTVEGGLVVRPRPWRQWPTALLVVAATALVSWVWAINVEPGKNLGFAMVLVVLWGIYIAESFLVKIIVTPERSGTGTHNLRTSESPGAARGCGSYPRPALEYRLL